ncbi:MAG: transglycosylase domain-containing protein [Clostridium sp.]|nr:transglycosylase domain-containing protein [Clostridium sp.]
MATNKKSSESTQYKDNVGSKKTNRKETSKVKRFFKSFFLTTVILGLIGLVTGLGYIFAVIKIAPELDVNSILNLNQPSMLYDDAGEFIDNLPTQEERYVISYNEMPQNLVNAYISIEDERFRLHKGIDVRRIIGAAIRDVLVIIKGEGGVHGASTITQQLVKNTILIDEASSEDTALDSINRKIKEISLSLQLEKKLTKDQIVEAYLNTIPLGGYIYGVEAASLYYFNKEAKDLTLPECAYLAGITQAPSYYSAYNTEEEGYPNTYIDRSKAVLMKMLELNYISQEDYDNAYAFVDSNSFAFNTSEVDYSVAYEWFSYPALDQVREDLKSTYKYTDEEVSKLFVNGGLKIYTTMNRSMQDRVQAVLNDRSNFDVKINGSYTEEPLTSEGVYQLQSAATVMDYKTGQVKALIGGRGYQPANSLNRAYDDLKSIASNTKPITVYGPAIDTKNYTAATPINDAPLTNEELANFGYSFQPTNWNGVYDGLITPREAIMYSKNITSLKVVYNLGLSTALEYGRKAGLIYNSVSEKSLATLALGEFNNDPNDRDGGNTTILASAYGSFGNSGVRTEAILYTKVIDSTGKVILDKTADTTKLFSEETAYIMYDILKGPVTGFDSSGAKFGDIPVAGKSGTTENSDSFWFSGLTPYYSASVWIGYDMPTRLDGYSSSAASLWGDVMGAVHEGFSYKEIEKPSTVVSATVCVDSGKLATDLCAKDQRGNRVRSEYFIEGTQPTTPCDFHANASINNRNNNSNSETISLSSLGLSKNMDLYHAINILINNQISYIIHGESISEDLTSGQYTVKDFTSKIKIGESVTLTIEKNPSYSIDNDDFDSDELEDEDSFFPELSDIFN